MPRARNIKYSFFTNDELADNDPLGRLLFIGLWTLADYKGELIWNPRRIKVEILPYDNCDIEALAINLDKSGFIRFYSVQGQTYLKIVNFEKHQNPHKNERARGSDVPPFSEDAAQVIDNKEVTINRDKNGTSPDKNETSRADSLSLIPDTGSLNPESRNLIPDEKPLSSKLADASDKKISFDEFYSKYPVKKSKEPARKIWQRLSDETRQLAITGIDNYLKSTDPKFIAHPSTYLNNKRWEDEPSTMQNVSDITSHNQKSAMEAIAAIRAREQQNAIK